MFSSLRKLVKSAIGDYERKEREQWVLDHCSQIVLTVSQMMWGRDVIEVLEGDFDRLEGMRDFEQRSFRDLNKLAAIVRGELPKLARAVLCALITLDVHARDMITDMVQKKVGKWNETFNSNNYYLELIFLECFFKCRMPYKVKATHQATCSE